MVAMTCSITCAQESCKASCNTARVRWAEEGKVTMVPVTMKAQVGRVKMVRARFLPGSATIMEGIVDHSSNKAWSHKTKRLAEDDMIDQTESSIMESYSTSIPPGGSALDSICLWQWRKSMVPLSGS